MSKSAHVVDGEASESDSEVEIAKSPDAEQDSSKVFVIAGEAPESDDESKIASPDRSDLDIPLKLAMTPTTNPSKIYNSLLHQKLCRSVNCMNCNILLRLNLERHKYYALNLGPELVSIAEEWCGREVRGHDRLCQDCFHLIMDEVEDRSKDQNHRSAQKLGHECVCVTCGISLNSRSRRRRHKLKEESNERAFVESEIFPRQVPIDALVCHSCWSLVAMDLRKLQPVEDTPVNEPTVTDEASAPSNNTEPSSEEEFFPDPLWDYYQ